MKARSGLLLWAPLLPALTCAAARAQTPATAEAAAPVMIVPQTESGAPPAAGTYKIEEIVVTANYRAQGIQDVVGSAQAFNGADLDKAGVAGMQGYLLQVPSVSFQPSGNGSTKIGMRGIANINASDLGYGDGSPTVGVYLNDVAIQGSGVMPDLRIFDLDRIEVLKGPQGTLYGEGSMGGAIKMVTNAPDANDWEFRTDGMYSWTAHGDPSHELRAAVNVPLLSDTLGARIVGTTCYDGGFVDYTALNRPDANGEHSDSLRGILNWKPLDRLSLGYMFLYNNDKRSQFPVVDDGAEQQLTNSGTENQYADTRFTINSLTAKLDLPFASLTSVSAWYRTYRDSQRRAPVLQSLVDTQFLGTGVTPPQIFTDAPTHVVTNLNSFSEELRLVSKGEHTIDWIAGAFYRDRKQTFQEQKYENSIPDVPALGQALGLLNLQSFDLLQGEQENGHGDEKFRQLAAYGEATWNIIPHALELTGGLRLFTENVSFLINTQFLGVEAVLLGTQPSNIESNGDVRVMFEQSLDTKGVLPKLSLGWHLTEADLLYATVSRGFRSGTPNIYSALSAGPPIVNPDYVWNKEIGYKSTWLKGRLVADLSAYAIDWQHLQGTVLGTAKLGIVPTQFAYLANAGDATVKGGELAITAKPLHHLTLNLNGGYNYGVLKSTAPNSGVVPGSPVPNSPRFTGSGTVAYVQPLPWYRLRADFSSTYAYVGPQLSIFQSASTNSLGQAETGNGYPIAGYGLLKASAGLARGALHMQLFGENLLDKRVVIAISAPIPQDTVLTPRVAGIRMSYDF